MTIARADWPAFDKACALMDIEVRRVPLKDYLADPVAMGDAADEQTVMIVGSAPCFPFGLIDPIEALGEVAERKNLWLHVDACVGAYIAPFVRMNGADLQRMGVIDGAQVRVVNGSGEARVAVIDVAEWKVVAWIATGAQPDGIALAAR